jgi:septum site-determining protein MinD
MEENADAGQAYLAMVARFLGENRPMRFTQAKKKFLDRLMGR